MSSWQFIYNSLTLMHILHLSVNSHVAVIEHKLPTKLIANLDEIPVHAAVHAGNLFFHQHHRHPQTSRNRNQTLQRPEILHNSTQAHSHHQKSQQEEETQKQLKTNSVRELAGGVRKDRGQHLPNHQIRSEYRWLLRHQAFGHSQKHWFTQWSRWTKCSPECRQRRQRTCKLKRKCGHRKHVEERRCRRCSTNGSNLQSTSSDNHRKASITNNRTVEGVGLANATKRNPDGPSTAVPTTASNHLHNLPKDPKVNFIIIANDDDSEESEFYIIKDRSRHSHRRKQTTADENRRPKTTKSEDLFAANKHNRTDNRSITATNSHHGPHAHLALPHGRRLQRNSSSHTPWIPYKRKKRRNKPKRDHKGIFPKQNLPHMGSDFEADIFHYDDFDIDYSSNRSLNGFSDEFSSSAAISLSSYEEDSTADNDNRKNATYLMMQHHMERATPNYLIPRHRRIYSKWSRWTKCSPKCTTRRYKKCRIRELCGREVLREIAYCYTEGSFCQQWLQAQVQKSPPYELKPMAARRRENSAEGMLSNSIDGDFILNSKGYRGTEYSPMKLKCGIAAIRNNRRNVYNMLKIIGGKASRKGEWPWQVAIFNRNKEAFCGGTLIAPQWILTAAHCVRKVLYVRMGEHNLDYEDGTELQLRIIKSYKHPNFDKKTVDSDVALLKLPKMINTTSWIGFSCLPRPYQPLPKNMDCTVIGWGKRRNRDVAGTSVLHQAEVPIIPMENCRSVYQDYTITKNMFCAGHKRGRIDTCAGDSGGPLLCRDTTKPNHPWTIFGITSFGDGCAKRNKFGIYAKVPNYVDWVWSVVNCNGNCKMSQANAYTI